MKHIGGTFVIKLFSFLTFMLVISIPLAGFCESGHVIRIGYFLDTFSEVDPKDAHVALEVLGDRFAMKREVPYKNELDVLSDLEIAVRKNNQGKIDILSLMSVEYLQIRDRLLMEPMFVPSLTEENPVVSFVLLVKEHQGINNLEQLRNKKIIVQKSGRGTIALMWLDTKLYECALPESKTFFHSIKKVEKVSHAVLPVFFDKVDACIVPLYAYETMAELNPQLNKQLSIQLKSPGFLMTMICMRVGMDKDVRESIMRNVDEIEKDSEGRQILSIMKTKKIVRYKADYLQSTEEMYKKYKELKFR